VIKRMAWQRSCGRKLTQSPREVAGSGDLSNRDTPDEYEVWGGGRVGAGAPSPTRRLEFFRWHWSSLHWSSHRSAAIQVLPLLMTLTELTAKPQVFFYYNQFVFSRLRLCHTYSLTIHHTPMKTKRKSKLVGPLLPSSPEAPCITSTRSSPKIE